MQIWEYSISGQIIIEGDTSVYSIYPENFTNLIKISNYRTELMPIYFTRLQLDKNFLDLIIKNNKNCTLHLIVTKHVKSDANSPISKEGEQPYIEDDFYIVLADDINYHKELDYMDTKEGEKPTEDRYKESYFGLISKTCLDANKKKDNIIFHHSDMQSMVLSYLTHTHLLIEPFDYNDEIDQLIMPPSDTLQSIIEYLNNIKVFYETKPIFFIDEPNATFLLSRSGKGTEMKGELSNFVNINVYSASDPNGMVEGMMIDSEKQAYVVNINGAASRYKVDHDTKKVLDKIDVIINPEDMNTIKFSEEVLKIKNQIDDIKSQFVNSISGYAKNIGDQINKLVATKNQVAGYINTTMKIVKDQQDAIFKKALEHFDPVPSTIPVKITRHFTYRFKIPTDAIKNKVANFMSSKLDIAGKLNKKAEKISQKLGDAITGNAAVKNIYMLENADNMMKALNFVNLSEIANQTSKNLGGIMDAVGKANQLYSSAISNISTFTSAANTMVSVVDKAAQAAQLIKRIQQINYYGKLISQYSNYDENMTKCMDNFIKMRSCTGQIQDTIKNVSSQLYVIDGCFGSTTKSAQNIGQYANAIGKLGNIDSISLFVDKLSNKVKDPSAALSSIKDSISTEGLKDLGSKLIKGTLKRDDINNLLKGSLSKVKDIDQIGKTGLTAISSFLPWGEGKDPNDLIFRSKIIRVQNDNPNKAKNLKSEVESMINVLTVNKFGLDGSVFTPNKKYVVHNYDAHSEKDGNFILNSKVEIFIREGNSFVCNTKLELSMVPKNNE